MTLNIFNSQVLQNLSTQEFWNPPTRDDEHVESAKSICNSEKTIYGLWNFTCDVLRYSREYFWVEIIFFNEHIVKI